MTEQVTKSIIIKANREKAFSVLANFLDYPRFIHEIQTVQPLAGDRTHWKVDGPLGRPMEFDLETTRFDPNQRIGWSTKDFEGDLTTSGQIVLAELHQGQTEVTVTLNYDAGGVASLLGRSPADKVEKILRNFKSYIEGMPERFEM